MNFTLERSVEILERTPAVLSILLQDISDDWTMNNEGGETWNVYDVIGHLIHGEKTDWIPRAAMILGGEPGKTFEAFDRFAQFSESKGKTLAELLEEFKTLRERNLAYLRALNIHDESLQAEGNHPVFGVVTLSQLLATWAVHDLNHLAQISRVMAKQYREAVGPWKAYLGVLNK